MLFSEHHIITKKNIQKFGLMMSTSLLTLLSTAAFAQEQTSSADDEELSEPITVTVTARRVEEDLNKAPVAVSVETERKLTTGSLHALEDIAKSAPNVMGFDSNGVSFVVRGVGSQSVQGLNSEVGVGLFLDEIYLGRPDSAPIYLDDLQRTEIVRGSQSTLYGKNTIGGAVNLVTREPGEEFSLDSEITYTSDGMARVKAGIDVPLLGGDWLTRSFLSYTHDPDTITNESTNESDLAKKAFSGRYTVIGDIGDNTSVKFTADFEKLKDEGKGGWALVDKALDHKSNLDMPAKRMDLRAGAMFKLDHDFDDFWLSSVTSYRMFDQDLVLDGDFGSGPYNPGGGVFELQQGREQRHWQVSKELRIGSHSQGKLRQGDFNWSGGLFYMHEDYDGFEFFEMANVARDQTSRDTLKSKSDTYSAFGSVEYGILDNLTVNAGGRLTREVKSGQVDITSRSGTNFYGSPQSGKADVKSTNFSPEIGVSYEFMPNSIVYGRVATGYKSGGIAQFFDQNGNVNTYDPEKSLTYEIGLKTNIVNDDTFLSVNLFNTDWTDQQTNVFISDFQRVTANAASATSRGIEIGVNSAITDELKIGLNYGYLESQFDDFVFDYYSANAGRNVTVDYSGNDIPLAPTHSGSVNIDWSRSFDNGVNIFANGGYAYRSSYVFDPVNAYRQDPTHLLDASIGVERGNWNLSLFAKNLLDEKYLTNYFLFNNQDYGIAANGTTVGVSLKTKW